MNWNRIERWEYVVEAVASEYHKKFPICEYEDIKQALYKWFIEHPNKLDTWEAIGEKDAKNLIYRSLRNEALDYCQKWKAKTVGYDVSDLYYYEPGLVEVLLPTVLMGNFHIAPKLNLNSGGGTECTGGAYTREIGTFTVSGTTTLATNSAAIEYDAATNSWGTIVAVGLFDASTAGNMLAFADLTTNKTIDSGDILRIPAGDLDITLS